MFRSAKMLVAGLSLATLVFAAPVRAEGDAPKGGDKPAKKEGGPRQGAPGERIMKMLETLNLTDDQKKQIEPIVEKMKTDMKALMDDKAIAQDDKRAKGMEIMKGAMQQVEALLTPEQKETLKKQREAHKGPGGPGGDRKGGKKGGDKGGDKGPDAGDKPAPAPAN